MFVLSWLAYFTQQNVFKIDSCCSMSKFSSFWRLNKIPFYKYIILCLHWSIDGHLVASTFCLLWILLLWTWVHKYLSYSCFQWFLVIYPILVCWLFFFSLTIWQLLFCDGAGVKYTHCPTSRCTFYAQVSSDKMGKGCHVFELVCTYVTEHLTHRNFNTYCPLFNVRTSRWLMWTLFLFPFYFLFVSFLYMFAQHLFLLELKCTK